MFLDLFLHVGSAKEQELRGHSVILNLVYLAHVKYSLRIDANVERVPCLKCCVKICAQAAFASFGYSVVPRESVPRRAVDELQKLLHNKCLDSLLRGLLNTAMPNEKRKDIAS